MFIPIRRIFIILGNACNLRCSYCIQASKHIPYEKPELSERFINYFKRVLTSQTSNIHITFFGGEPLLYMDTIKEILNLFNTTEKKCTISYGIISNGKALSEDIINYLNENDISINISWDGRNVLETRGYDAIADKHDLLFKINKLGFVGVLSNINYPIDWLQAVKPFAEEYKKVRNYYPSVNLEVLNNHEHNCTELTKFDFYKLREQFGLLATYYYQGKDTIYKKFINGFVNRVEKGINDNRVDMLTSKCGNALTVPNIDLEGNLFYCHNTNEKIGHGDMNFPSIIKRAILRDNTNKVFENMCTKCSIRNWCLAGCPLLSEQDRKDYYCDMEKAIYEPIIDVVKQHI